jgi:hypothetical protein
LTRIKQLTAAAFEASFEEPDISLFPPSFIVKIARFEWEIPRLERETHIYSLLEGTGIG